MFRCNILRKPINPSHIIDFSKDQCPEYPFQTEQFVHGVEQKGLIVESKLPQATEEV